MTQRVTRDLQALERRRKQAARLFAKGNLPQASVARELKVSRMSVSRWHRQCVSGGGGGGHFGGPESAIRRQCWVAPSGDLGACG